MLEIERAWGAAPGWFNAQPREQRVQLLAWYRVHLDPEGKRYKAKRAKGRAFWGV